MEPSGLVQHLRQWRRFAALVVKSRTRLGPQKQDSLTRFHQLYYESEVYGGTWKNTYWMGVPVWKCPFDLWVYQEILYDLVPGLVIETGTAWGGSALFLASVFDLLGRGRVMSIDLRPRHPRPVHPRIRYLQGSSTDPAIVSAATLAAEESDGVMVLLDSDHRRDHVFEELQLYSPLVSLGGYIVVEDTNINGHPVAAEFGPGPMEAVERFIAEDRRFRIDRELEKFRMTLNPRGFLKRIG